MKYKRILLKLSGESLAGSEGFGLDGQMLDAYARQISEARSMGAQIAVVLGGGNIFRGLKGMEEGVDRFTGDYMGMLATVINCMALQSYLEKGGIPVKLLTGLHLYPMAERFYGPKAIEYLEKGNVILLGGGTGNPYFTTDSAAALRAVEIKADAVLKGTRVDGVYSTDPEKDPKALKFDRISFREAYEKGLRIMDLTAFTLCEENRIPIVVFNVHREGNLTGIIQGEAIGTLVS